MLILEALEARGSGAVGHEVFHVDYIEPCRGLQLQFPAIFVEGALDDAHRHGRLRLVPERGRHDATAHSGGHFRGGRVMHADADRGHELRRRTLQLLALVCFRPYQVRSQRPRCAYGRMDPRRDRPRFVLAPLRHQSRGLAPPPGGQASAVVDARRLGRALGRERGELQRQRLALRDWFWCDGPRENGRRRHAQLIEADDGQGELADEHRLPEVGAGGHGELRLRSLAP
mmetsp:Transcript_19777/g.54487  ORF Transcript_19777/g.54487 Transcript_19777/m.54487 type:complete len:229 (-) Transcript_19777:1101-1787(-)